MTIRDISIKNRLNIGFGLLMAIIVLLCFMGFRGTANGGTGIYYVVICIASLAFGTASSLLIRKSITDPIDHITRMLQRLADGDLTMDNRLSVETKDEWRDGKAAIKSVLVKWRALTTDMKSAAGKISSAAQDLSAGAEQMSMGVEEQASRSSQVATASEEMSQSILDVARNVANIAGSASNTVEVAKNGDQIVTKSVEKVKEISDVVNASAAFVKSLGERSKQIGDIVIVIKDIADQTNLLALNAAIEAARAGEHGRGFAVVADEVRKLAERTAKSTSEIGDMTRAIQGEVSEAVRSMDKATNNVTLGVDLVVQAGSALQAIVQSVDDLQLMVQQIASATEEMSATSEEINKDIEKIASVSKDTSSSADNVARASTLLTDLSDNMENASNQFTL